MIAALALALALLAPSNCEYRPTFNATLCTFSIAEDRVADPGEFITVRGQMRALNRTTGLDSVQRRFISVGSMGNRGNPPVTLNNSSYVAISELAGWHTWGSVRHAPGVESTFRWTYAIFAGNEEGNVRIRTHAVIRAVN